MLTVTATVNDGYDFVNWTEDGAFVSDKLSYTFNVNSDRNLVANFQIEDGGGGTSLPVSDDAESGSSIWSPGSLWHITDRKSNSPTHSWWFGDERTGTYGPGEYIPSSSPPPPASASIKRSGEVHPTALGGVRGELTSAAISVADWENTVNLSFQYWRHVEYYPDGAYDKTYVQVSFFDDNWQTVWSEDSRDPSEKAWVQVSIPIAIPEGATEMRVRFVFDSVDDLNNDYPGWFIDDIELGSSLLDTAIRVIAPLVDGAVREAYGPVNLSASGGVPPYTWVWRPGVPGLTLDPRSGTISGIPTEAGSFEVTITATDSAGNSGSFTARISISSEPGCDCSLFFEDFFDAAGWTMTGLWNVTSGLPCIASASMIDEYAYFGRDAECSYATGARVQGYLKSPAIDIPDCVESVVIEFDHFRHVEMYPDGYDQTRLEVSFDGASWETLWYRDSSSPSPDWGHVQVGITVPDGATKMWIRFGFDSVDGYYNEFPGWTIDNVEVLNAACVGGTGALTTSLVLPVGGDRATPRGQLRVTNSPNPVTDVHTTTFKVQGADAEALRIQIFDLSGLLVYENEVQGGELEWHTENDYGEYLANGVYLYIATVRIGGVWIGLPVQKLVILR